MTIDDEYELNRVCWIEFSSYKPINSLLKFGRPVLIVHGDKDTYVPVDVSRWVAKQHRKARCVIIAGADHGFPEGIHEKNVRAVTMDFLREHLQ